MTPDTVYAMLIPAFMHKKLTSLVAILGALALGGITTSAWADSPSWSKKEAPLMTRWAKDVNQNNAHQEYPRPQLTRDNWINLNGLWDLAIVSRDQSKPENFNEKILVPFPVESALSGVMRMVKDDEQIWYQRNFSVPQDWDGKKMLLHFGACDWDTTVYVNGKKVGSHKGGYTAFSMDITDALVKDQKQTITVSVWDPTSSGTQPRGKQISNPHGIWYTPTSGIWQTVWLEPVSKTYKLAEILSL